LKEVLQYPKHRIGTATAFSTNRKDKSPSAHKKTSQEFTKFELPEHAAQRWMSNAAI